MTSPITPQNGQFNMSYHPSMACHQPALMPNMEVQSAIPAKRGPEEDVQFVSVKPVKKARGSRESPPSQIQPTPQQQNNHHVPGQQLQVKQANDAQPGDNGVARPSLAPIPSHDRGLSFPGMESYVFPPPSNAMPSRTSRSSPVLSPRQLPQSMLPPQPRHTMQIPGGYLTPGSGYRGPVPPPNFQVPWGMSALYPQSGPAHPEAYANGAAHVPAVQPQHAEPPARCIEPGPAMDIDDQPLSMTTALRRPEHSRAPSPVSRPEPQGGPQSGQVASAQDGLRSRLEEPSTTHLGPSDQVKHGLPQNLQQPSPRQETQSNIQDPPQARVPSRIQSQTPSQAHTPPSTPNAGQSQAQSQSDSNNHSIHHAMGGHQVLTGHQAARAPCAICDQMRQQFLYNQANGLPTGHLAQLQHGWHGQGQVPQMHMGHLPPPVAAGYGMVPNMYPGFQQRYQPLSLGPLGHLPLGYGMQSIPVQMQMQIQRQAAASNMPGAEPSHNGLLGPQSPQGQQNQEPQQSQGQVFQFAAGPSQPQPPQYIQSQLQPMPQAMLQRPMLMHAQALAPQAPLSTSPEQLPAPDPTPQATQASQQSSPPSEPPKERSPNLIVDIAETCEELFPWDEVAKRHGVTRVKVVETFGAVIQLPLLRCTGDKKKHGKLATSRLREYTKAKKDAEAQNAAEAANAAARAKKKTTKAPAAAKAAAPAQQAKKSQPAKPQESQAQAHQAQENQAQATQSQSQQAMEAQAAQMQTAQSQAMQAQAQAAMHANQAQNQAMHAQHAIQMQATQSHLNQGFPPQLQQHQDHRPTLPGVFELANMSPLGLPSNHANGLPGPWQQQQQQHPQQHQQ